MILNLLRKSVLLLRKSAAVILVASLLVTVGCRDETAETTQAPAAAPAPEPAPEPEEPGMLSSAFDALKDGASRVQRAVEPYASPIQSTAVESVQKMLAIEYRIIEFGLEEPSDLLEKQLKNLGGERWDCSPMPPTFSNSRFLCKRYPLTSYLKAISLLSKLTPD